MKKLALLFIFIFIMIGCTNSKVKDKNSTSKENIKNVKQKEEVLEIPKLEGPKKKIAVLNFEDKTTIHWYKYDLGKGVSDMLITELVKSNNFLVVEREMIDKIVAEQNLSATGLLAPTAINKIGKLLGVDIIITGGVTEFGVGEDGAKFGGWVLGAATNGLVSGVGVKTYTARVAVDIRMIDVSTGQIISAETANATEKDSKVDFNSWTLPDFSIGSNKFNSSLIGKATRKAINNLVAKISINSEKLTWKGYVLKVSGNEVWINAGSKSGIKEGMKFSVRNRGEEIIDAEGEIYIIPGKEIAEIEVVEVTEKVSKAKVISGKNIEKDFEVALK